MQVIYCVPCIYFKGISTIAFQCSDASTAVKLSKWCPLPGALPSSVIVDYAFHCIAMLCNCWLCIARLGLSNSSPFFPSASYWAKELFFHAKGALITASGFLLLCKISLQSTLFEFQWRCTISFASFYVQSWLGLILSWAWCGEFLLMGRLKCSCTTSSYFPWQGATFLWLSLNCTNPLTTDCNFSWMGYIWFCDASIFC